MVFEKNFDFDYYIYFLQEGNKQMKTNCSMTKYHTFLKFVAIPVDSATASDTSEGETASGCRGTIAGAGGMITLFVSVLAALTLRRKKESYDA